MLSVCTATRGCWSGKHVAPPGALPRAMQARIYLDGRSHPKDLKRTSMGH